MKYFVKQFAAMKQARVRGGAPLGEWLQAVGGQEAFVALAELNPGAAVFVVDRERRILFWSSGAESLLGFSASEVVGEHCLKANRCRACVAGCGIEKSGVVQEVPLTLHRASGAPTPVRKSGRAFFDAQGQFAGGIEVLRAARLEGNERPSTMPPRASDTVNFHGIVSRDPAMLLAFQTIRNVAETDATVLVRGESGTGKELVARAVHEESHRADGPFVAVNCAALTPSLLESELFGHVKGAFTGAAKDRAGLFQQADSGTLFLDEVAELSMEVQAKLLRALEQREVVPVGATRPRSVNVRVVAATHRALRKEAKAGRFREDLMYRLRVVPLFIPALRDRPTDVAVLFRHFVALGNKRGPRRVEAVAPEVMRSLLHHGWPGNVRELRNVIEYAFAVGRSDTIELEELPPEFREDPASGSPSVLRGPDSDQERKAIAEALAASGGHIGRAAQRLGVSRPTLWRKRKKHGI